MLCFGVRLCLSMSRLSDVLSLTCAHNIAPARPDSAYHRPTFPKGRRRLGISSEVFDSQT